MDGICSAVLNKIYALGTPGRYFVIASDEFFEVFPEDSLRNEGELKGALKSLSADGYIDIKYSSGSLYCVALLKQFVPEPPPQADEDDGFEEYCEQPIDMKTSHMSAFWASFAGGAVGSTVIGVLFLILNLIIK